MDFASALSPPLEDAAGADWAERAETESFGGALPTVDEFAELATKALLSRLRWVLAAERLWPADAFRLLDKAGAGALRLSDFQFAASMANCSNASSQLSAICARSVDRNGKLVLWVSFWVSDPVSPTENQRGKTRMQSSA